MPTGCRSQGSGQQRKWSPRRLSSILRLGRRCWRAVQKCHYPSETRTVDWSVGHVEVHAFEGVAGHLRPDAILLHRHFVDLNIVHFELSALLVHPAIDVVILVLAASLPEGGTHKVFAFLLQVSHRLVDLNEVKRQRLAGLVILDVEVAVPVLMGSDVAVDRTHHLPSAGHFHTAGMLLHW